MDFLRITFAVTVTFPQRGPKLGFQFGQIVRFDHIVIGRDRFHVVSLRIIGGVQNDRKAWIGDPYRLEQIQPMAIVHSDIQDYHRRLGGFDAGQRLIAGACCDDFMAFFAQLFGA
jgi:hypothetical protein